MQLILEKIDNSYITVVYCYQQKNQRNDKVDYFSWAEADRRAGQGYLSPRRGGCGFCFAATVQDHRRDAEAIAGRFASETFGDDAGLREAGGKKACQAAGTQKRTSRQSATAAGADRSARGASAEALSALRHSGQKMQSYPHAVHRGHSRGPQSGGDGTHYPPRLVPEVQKGRGTGGDRRFAELRVGQPRAGADCLAALCLGQHSFADHRSLQFPFAHQIDCRWTGRSVASFGGDSRTLVRTDTARGERICGVARRRNQLAGGRENALAVVFRGGRSYLFYDRPLSGFAGAFEVLQSGISGNIGKRLLGRLQQGTLRAQTTLPGTSAARLFDRGAIQASGKAVARVRQKGASLDPRRDPAGKTRRPYGRGVRLASRTPGLSLAGTDQHALGGFPGAALDKASAATSRRVVHVSRSSGRSFRQQPRRTQHSPGGNHTQKQLLQSQRQWRPYPGGADEHLPHPKTTRPRSPQYR